MTLRRGDIIDGRYRVERVIGKGGMGLVLETTHLALGTKVAIKILRKLASLEAKAMENLIREAQLAASLRGQHVVRVFDVGMIEDGAPYVAMEHLEGCSLHDLLLREGTLSVARASEIMSQVCDALAEAHAHGIVHRDLKPANVFLVRQPNGTELVKVLDFGIARLAHVAPGEDTRSGAILGTPHYMPPESFDAPSAVTPAFDIWSMGVIFFELLAGRRPFDGTNPIEIIWRVTSMDRLALPALRADVPKDVVDLIDRCLSKDPAARPASALEIADALKKLVPPESGPSLAFSTAPTTTTKPPPPKRRRAIVPIAMGLAAIALVSGFAVRARSVDRPHSLSHVALSRAALPAPTTLEVRGSTTVGELAQPLEAALAATRSDIAFSFEPSSSGAGMGALVRGEIEIAFSSRPASPAEIASATNSGAPLVETVIAHDGIAVIVNPDNPVTTISVEQLRDILTGKITNWSSLGGRHAKIDLFVRPEQQGSSEVLKANVLEPNDHVVQSAEVVKKTEDVADRVHRDANALGFVTFGETGANKALKLKVAGGKAVPPSATTIRARSYPLGRDLYVYSRTNASARAKDLVTFFVGPGQQVVKESGFVAVTE